MINLEEKVDELKRQYILDTASKYFREFGYEKTQIDKIAKELTIGVGTIYGYFKSKEGLFLAWIKRIADNSTQEIKKSCANILDPKEKLALVIENKLKYFEQNKISVKGYLENNQLFLKGISRRKEHPMAAVYDYISDLLKEIKDFSDDDARLLAQILDGIINSYIEFLPAESDFLSKKDEIFERFSRLAGI